MKEPYETPVLEIIEFEEEDIILASGGTSCTDVGCGCDADVCTDGECNLE